MHGTVARRGIGILDTLQVGDSLVIQLMNGARENHEPIFEGHALGTPVFQMIEILPGVGEYLAIQRGGLLLWALLGRRARGRPRL